MIVAEKLRYVVRKRGKLFWQPTPEMRLLGFQSKPLGADTPEARDEARALARKWDEAKSKRGVVTNYPPGSLGAFYDRLKGNGARPSIWWNKKSLRTREDYERAWKNIDAWRPAANRPLLSHTLITSISTELCEQFFVYLDGTSAKDGKPGVPGAVSPNERWRTIKGFKILLHEAVVRLKLGYESPAASLTNAQPAGRWQIWLGHEVDALALRAVQMQRIGLSLGIRSAWETLFSPVDVRTLSRSMLKRDGTGWYFHRERTKTTKEAFAAISDQLADDILAYVDSLGFALADNAPMFRQRDGHAYRNKDTWSGDFRDVRDDLYPKDKRQFQDLRRSGNVEADIAGADKETMGELLANTLAKSKFLEETYTPPTVAKAREVALQRIQGRAKLATEAVRQRSKS